MHIADVTHFIRPGTALDDEAANRATTVYLTDKVFLPHFIDLFVLYYWTTQYRSLLFGWGIFSARVNSAKSFIVENPLQNVATD